LKTKIEQDNLKAKIMEEEKLRQVEKEKKTKITQEETVMASPAAVQPQAEAKSAYISAQKQISTRSSASSAYGSQPKKKAADFYFQKGKQEEQAPKSSKKN